MDDGYRIERIIPRRAFVALAGAGIVLPAKGVTEEDRAAGVVRRYLAARARGDLDAVAALFTDDCRYEDRTFQYEIRGLEAVRAMFKQAAAGISESQVKVENLFSTGSWVCAQWKLSGIHSGLVLGARGNGARILVDGVSVLRVDTGKIAHQVDYMDRHTLERQLGIEPVVAPSEGRPN